MKLQTYIEKQKGNATKLSAHLGIPLSFLSQMATGNRSVSPERALAIERITSGRVTRQDLRPNDYWLIWPDLAAPVSVLAEKQAAQPERRKADLEAEPVEGMHLESRSAADKAAAKTTGVL